MVFWLCPENPTTLHFLINTAARYTNNRKVSPLPPVSAGRVGVSFPPCSFHADRIIGMGISTSGLGDVKYRIIFACIGNSQRKPTDLVKDVLKAHSNQWS